MDFRRKLLKAGNSLAALKAEKRNAELEAKKEKKKRDTCLKQLLIAVNQELQTRRAGSSRGKKRTNKCLGDKSSEALVLHQASRQDSPGAKVTPRKRRTGDLSTEAQTRRWEIVKAPTPNAHGTTSLGQTRPCKV